MTWDPLQFRALLGADELKALDYLMAAWRAGTLDGEFAVREMLRTRRLVNVAVLLGRDIVARQPSKGVKPLFEVLLTSGAELAQAALLPSRPAPSTPRLQELIRRVAEGNTLTDAERAEMAILLSDSGD